MDWSKNRVIYNNISILVIYVAIYIYQRIHFVFEYFHVANMRIKVFADVAAMSRLLHFISRYTQNGSQQQHTAWSRFYFSRWFMEIAKFISNLFGYCNILGPSRLLLMYFYKFKVNSYVSNFIKTNISWFETSIYSCI